MNDQTIKSLLHFDDGLYDDARLMSWGKLDVEDGEENNAKFGGKSAHFTQITSKVQAVDTEGVFTLNHSENYEIECFIKPENRGISRDGYKFYGGHTFKVFTDTKTWANAKIACEALGGHLATSTSEEKNAFLAGLTTEAVWLGASDEAQEGTWVWVTGEEWSYTNWANSQPDNAGSKEHYVHLNTGGTGNWNDNNATTTLGYICEWDSDTEQTLTEIFVREKGYRVYNGHTFKYIRSSRGPCAKVKLDCETSGGHLATSTSAEKNDFLCSFIREKNLYASVLIGGIRNPETGTWSWVTGEPLDYTNWHSNEPSTNSDYNYMMIKAWDTVETGTWSSCGNYWYDYICEWDYDITQDIDKIIMIEDGYRTFGGHTFKGFVDYEAGEHKTWQEAKVACETVGGHLATSTSAEKNDFLVIMLFNKRNNNYYYGYLGGYTETDDGQDGVWQWITGEEWDYSNWGSGYPNNTRNTNPGYRCLLLTTELNSDAKWQNAYPNWIYGYICEWDYDLFSLQHTNNILNLGDALTLTLTDSNTLNLKSSAWGINRTSTLTLNTNTWYHLMLRITGKTLKVYLNGAEAISASISGNTKIKPNTVTLGGYTGYMDEFIFRHTAGTNTPIIPTSVHKIKDISHRDFGDIKSLVHFDFPYYNEPHDGLDDEVRGAVWEREGNTKLAGVEIPYEYEGAPKFGYRCAYYPDDTSHVVSNNTDGVFNLDTTGSYECECFAKAETVEEAISTGDIFNFGDDITLSIASGGTLTLTSSAWSIDSTSTLTLSADTWHHILLRLANNTAKVYLDGAEAITTAITGDTEIAPEVVRLGGYVGFMDEFVFRDTAKTKAPVVPTYPYRGRVNNSSVGGYGTGTDGDVVISANTQINNYGIISSIEDIHTLTVSSWSNGSVVPAVGTEVMIHITAPKSTEGAKYPLVGLYAFSEISAIDGTTIALTDKIARGSGFDFNLDSSLLDTYYVQVITVPNYASLTVDSGKKITPLTWSTSSGGGIVAFRCTGDCTINGSILTHGYGATRYDLQQMTNAKLIDRFLCAKGGGIFIACGGTLTAPSTARLGASTSGLGDGNNGAAGYGGNGGSNNVASGGLGGVGGGGGGAARNYTSSVAGGDCGEDGNNATGGSGGGGCGGRGGRGSSDNLAGGGGGGQGGSGGVIEGLNASTSKGHIPQAGTINGGNHGDVANGAYQSGAGGGGPGGNGGDGSWYISGRDTGTLKGSSAGASIILIVEALKADIATFSTGGSAGISYTSTNSNLRTGGGGGGGTGFCYIACREQVSDNA